MKRNVSMGPSTSSWETGRGSPVLADSSRTSRSALSASRGGIRGGGGTGITVAGVLTPPEGRQARRARESRSPDTPPPGVTRLSKSSNLRDLVGRPPSGDLEQERERHDQQVQHRAR